MLPHFDRWRQPAKGVDNSQNAYLAAIEQLVMNKVHSPDLVASGRRRAIVAQLCLDTVLG